LSKAADAIGREYVVTRTGLPHAKILRFVYMADLQRVKGLGNEYSMLLLSVGIETVPELKIQDADLLYARLKEMNTTKKMIRQLPSLNQLKKLIRNAQPLEALVDVN